MRKKERKAAEVSVLKTVTPQPGIFPITIFFFFFFALEIGKLND